MGYNNNYAGIHMIRYSRYGQYDDLKYYDKLAEQERQCKKVNARPENSNSEDRKNKFKKKLGACGHFLECPKVCVNLQTDVR